MVDFRNINVNLYRTFVVVAESDSFLKASEKLNTTYKVVLNDINSLENQLGVQLFFRKNKGLNYGLKITDMGNEIYSVAKRIVCDCDFIPQIINSSNCLENGKLSIGCPSHISEFFFMERLSKLFNDCPSVEVKLDTESSSRKMLEAVKNNELDFMIFDSVPEEALNEFEIKKIKDIDNILVSKQKIEISDIKQLENYNFILSYETRTSTKKLMKFFNEYKLNLKVGLRCPTTEQRIKASKLDLGIAYVMKDAVKKELDSNELYEVKVPIKLPTNSINLVYIKERLTKVDKEFIKKYINDNV